MMSHRTTIALIAVFTFASSLRAQDAPPRFPSPVSPEESLQHFQLDPELKIELVAAEPQIVDPVAIQFGADGSLWVVEMRDYPYGPKPGEKPQSQIVRLLDNDGDGRFEMSTVFADELLFATGALPYRDGLIVTLAGKITFFADRDGDGKAEVRETWFSGFAQENSQLRANHPTYGPDGYVYVANGLRGGKIVAERAEWKKTGEPLEIKGFDFRFHPETGEFSTITGHGQFGLCFDDYGRRFVCSNRNPCQHVVLEDWYLKRNPQFAAKAVMHDVCAAAEKSKLYPISAAWTTSTLHANQFTAACGVTILRGYGLSPAYYGNVFTCDPTGNLVHREVLAPHGATFRGRSPYENREFLASPDTWFQPVNLANGPDGALYVVDMYRAVIEHPDFMPTELKNRPDLMKGTDRGRVYRIVHRDHERERPLDLTALSNGQLAEMVHSSWGWRSETASRLLVERHAIEVLPQLRQLMRGGNQLAVVRTMQQLGGLTVENLFLRLKSFGFGLVENPGDEDRVAAALQVVDPFLANDKSWCQWIVPHLRHEELAFPATLALSMVPPDETVPRELAKVALSQSNDPWLRAAIIIAARDQTHRVLMHVARLSQNPRIPPPAPQLIEELTEVVAANRSAADLEPLVRAFAELNGAPTGFVLHHAFLRGLGRGRQRRGAAWEKELDALPDGGEAIRERLQDWALAAAETAMDSRLPAEERVAAIQTLRWSSAKFAPKVLLPLVVRDGNSDVALAACDALAALPSDDVAPALLDRFPSAVPAVRRAILDVLLAQPSRAKLLIDAVEAGDIKPPEIDPQRTNRLLNHRDPILRERAKTLLAAGSADRAAVLAQYEPAIQNLGDAYRGKAIFGKHCVTCHRIAGVGVNVGADIGDTRDKTPSYLLTAILDPNRAVDNNYFGYAVATKDGKTFTGVIAAETSTSITLKQAEGKTETILRSDIEELRATGQSFMPVGFEKNISVEEMADLVSFLKNWRYLDGAVPVGK